MSELHENEEMQAEVAAKAVKKTKEQLREEKEINSSMVRFSSRNRDALGIISVQPEKNVFCLQSGYFVKIYSLKGVELSISRKKILVSALLGFTEHRMRLSSFKYSSASSSLVFLTVYFPGKSFSGVVDEIREFDENLHGLMENRFKLSFNECSVGDVFMFSYMNFNGQMKKITNNAVLRKSANLRRDYFQDIVEVNGGFMMPKNGKYGNCVMAMQFPDEIRGDVFESVRALSGGYISCIDFQDIGEENMVSYSDYLDESYNSAGTHEFGSSVNLTFVFGFLFNTKKEMFDAAPVIRDSLAGTGLVYGPCVGVERRVYESIASLGIYDFHCMRSVNVGLLGSLIG